MTLEFKRETYNDVVDYLENLSTTMTDETDLGHDYVPDLDHEQFYALEDMGNLCVITARKDGEIVGFVIATIQNDIFFKTKRTAFGLFYYLNKDCRGNGNGFHLMKFADDEFKRSGAVRAVMTRKLHINNEKVFTKLGYNPIEAVNEKYY